MSIRQKLAFFALLFGGVAATLALSLRAPHNLSPTQWTAKYRNSQTATLASTR